MKFLIVLSACLVVSVYSRVITFEEDGGGENPIIIRDEPSGGENPIIIRDVPSDDSGNVVIRQQPPQQNDNIIGDLFKTAAQITSKTAEGIGNIAKGALQGTASFGQGLVNGAQQGLTSALENTGDVAAKFSNGVEHEVDNWWTGISQK